MFLVDFSATAYSDPWLLSLTQRLKMLGTGRYRIAYYYESANNSTFRYRAYNMAQVLNSEPGDGVCGSYFFQSDLHRLDEITDNADVLVICRSGYNHKINQLVNAMRKRRKRVIFDIDDFVFDVNYTHLVVNTLGLDMDDPRVWDDWFGMMSRMGQTLRLCDSAITTNTYLACRISEFSGLPVEVVPNFMNHEQLALSRQLFERKSACGFARDETIYIGYFSGSPSHKQDYAIIESALEATLESDSRVRVMTVGYIEPGASLKRFGNRIVRQPFQDYVNLQGLISKVEFNMMPLQTNIFTHCKSELKYFEAAAVGTLSIASPSHNYLKSIENGVNGYIARAHEWTKVINEAINNLPRCAELATVAHADALQKYAGCGQREKILKAVGLD